jgi:uncharacterized glyoxalase superfamily protein PhnB
MNWDLSCPSLCLQEEISSMDEPQIPHVVPSFTVAAIEPLRDFYIEKLGFAHMMGIVGKDGKLDTAIVTRDGMTVMLGRPEQRTPGTELAPAQGRVVDIYFYIRDVDGYHAEVTARGVEIVDPLTTHWWGDRSFRVKDPYGYSLWFAQTVGEFQPPTEVNAI